MSCPEQDAGTAVSMGNGAQNPETDVEIGTSVSASVLHIWGRISTGKAACHLGAIVSASPCWHL